MHNMDVANDTLRRQTIILVSNPGATGAIHTALAAMWMATRLS